MLVCQYIMQSFIVSSKAQEKAEEYVIKFCQDCQIDNFDIEIIQRDGSIGIEEIRNLQKKIFLKPLAGNTKATIIKNSQNLTPEAQNALLKVLEEPPPNTVIILTTQNKDLLLPTIRSRCKIIHLQDTTSDLLEKKFPKTLNFLMSLLSYGVGDRFKLAQDISKTKQDSIAFLEEMIISIRHWLVKNYTRNENPNKALAMLKKFQKAHTILSTTNVNPRLTLENLFLGL